MRRLSSRRFSAVNCFVLVILLMHLVAWKVDGFAMNQHQQTNRSTRLHANNPTAGELTNTLARIDGLWKKSQSPFSRWNKLLVGSSNDDIAYLLEPPFHSVPSSVIVFTGGAGLGTYPQVAYNEFLMRISNQLNAAVITVPYPVFLDHTKLAQRNGKLTQSALAQAERQFGYSLSQGLPIYSLAHSLGSKLACIDAASIPKQVHADAYGFISFNNFGFDQTFKMAKKFGETLRTKTGLGRNMEHEMLVDGFFTVAEAAVRWSGVEFQPSPDTMLKILDRRWNTRATRLFTFDDDTMDNAKDFVMAAAQVPPEVSALPGTHLTPVYFDLQPPMIGSRIRRYRRVELVSRSEMQQPYRYLWMKCVPGFMAVPRVENQSGHSDELLYPRLLRGSHWKIVLLFF